MYGNFEIYQKIQNIPISFIVCLAYSLFHFFFTLSQQHSKWSQQINDVPSLYQKIFQETANTHACYSINPFSVCSLQLGVDFRGITKYYEEEFFTDMDKLRVMRPTVAPRVTEHIPHIISFIEKVIEKKLAYSVSDGECRHC